MVLPGLYAALSRKSFIVEINGLLAQDLDDRHRGFIPRALNRITEWITYRLCTAVVVVHENLIPPLADRYGVALDKFRVIENGTKRRNWRSPQDARTDLGINPDARRVGYFGSVSAREGVDELVRAVATDPNGDYQTVLVGGTPDEVSAMRELARQLGVDGRVEFLGSLTYDKAMAQMESCDVLVHLRRPMTVGSGDSQGSPLKMLDYHCVGRPVLATDVSSYTYIREQRYGTLVKGGDPQAAAEGIAQILNSPNRCLDDGKRAHDWVSENRLWEHSVERLETELLSVLAKRQS